MTTDRIAVDIKVPNQTRYLCLIGHIGENIAHTLRNYSGDREKLAYDLNLVLTEGMANAILHANQGDPAKEVHIEISIVKKDLFIKVFDLARALMSSSTSSQATLSMITGAAFTSCIRSWTRSPTDKPKQGMFWKCVRLSESGICNS